MGKEKRPFCCHQNFVPNGLSASARDYVYNWAASWQNQQNGMCAQQRHTVWSESLLCSQWVAKDPSFLHADSEDSDQTGWMPRPIWVFAGRACHFVGFVMRWLIWWNMKKNLYKIGLQSNFFKPKTNGQKDKGFLLTSTFVPKGLSAPALGLYTCIKALKYILGPGVRWAFTGPLVLWFSQFMSILKIFVKICIIKDVMCTFQSDSGFFNVKCQNSGLFLLKPGKIFSAKCYPVYFLPKEEKYFFGG